MRRGKRNWKKNQIIEKGTYVYGSNLKIVIGGKFGNKTKIKKNIPKLTKRNPAQYNSPISFTFN